MKKAILALLVLVGVCVVAGGVYFWLAIKKIENTDPTVWESTIEQFERQDAMLGARSRSTVFVGSSSVATFEGLGKLMAPDAIVRRGFGGASVSDVRHYRKRIIDTYRPEKIILYVGAIDVYFHSVNAPGKVVSELRRLFVETIDSNPGAEVYYIAIRPSPFEPDKWKDIDYVNAGVEAFAKTSQRLTFIDANDSVRDEQGRLREDLYKLDRMHLNDTGNQLWWGAFKQRLDRVSAR